MCPDSCSCERVVAPPLLPESSLPKPLPPPLLIDEDEGAKPKNRQGNYTGTAAFRAFIGNGRELRDTERAVGSLM